MTVFFDLETTGSVFATDKIIEISCIKVDDDRNIIDKYHTLFNNEGVAINPAAFEVHGISEEDLVGEPLFKDKANEIVEFFEGCSIGGYNIRVFDIPFLYTKLLELGIKWDIRDREIIDVFSLYKKYNGASLGEVYSRYVGKKLDNAHSAEADTLATIELYNAQIARDEVFETQEEVYVYKEMLDIGGNLVLKEDIDGVKRIFFTFGKHKGERLDRVDRRYLEWICKNDFPIDLKIIIRKYLEKTS